MSTQPPNPPSGASPKKSILLPLGILLVLLGILVPRLLTQVAIGMQPGMLRSIALISTDLFRLCFFAGVVCVIIGALRRRKQKQEPPKSNS
jgi:hypothetical protein